MTFVDRNLSEANELSARARQDLALIEKALAGSTNAYEVLMHNYRKSVYHIVLKMVRNSEDAEDITIEAFAKAFRYLARYRPTYAFSTWLFRIATNNCIDFMRRKKVHTVSLQNALPHGDNEGAHFEVPDHNPNPQDAFIRQQRAELIQLAVATLPTKYAKLVRMRYFDELSYEEVATELQVPLGTVKAQLFRARELLTDMLKDSENAL